MGDTDRDTHVSAPHTYVPQCVPVGGHGQRWKCGAVGKEKKGLHTWSCLPQMTCVGALILLMFSCRECLDFSFTISKNTRGAKKTVSLTKGVLCLPFSQGPC